MAVCFILILIATHIYSWEINKNGLRLPADLNVLQNDKLTTKKVNDESVKYLKNETNEDKQNIQETAKIQQLNDYETLSGNVQSIANIIPSEDFSRIVYKLENLLKNVVLPSDLGNRRLYSHMKYTNGNEQFSTLNPQEYTNVKKVNSIINLDNIEQLAGLNKFQEFHESKSVESKLVLNYTPYLGHLNSQNQASTFTLPDSPRSHLIDNFTNEVPQVTLTPAQLHSFLKNLHVINKRHTFQSGMQFSNSPIILNENLPMTNSNLDSTLPKHLSYDFHLPQRQLYQYNKQYARSFEDGDGGKCVAGSSWASDCRKCTCNEAREQRCVKMPTCALRQLVTCKPLTYFTLNLCTQCYCDVNAIPKCYSKCRLSYKERTAESLTADKNVLNWNCCNRQQANYKMYNNLK